MNDITFRFIDTNSAEYRSERTLRVEVLRKPIGLPAGTEEFPFENESLHLVAIRAGKVVGCLLFHPEGATGRMFQIAVALDLQKTGIGQKLVETMLGRLKSDGFEEVYGHARNHAVDFFRHLGFETYGEPFKEIGIEHRLIRINLKDWRK